MTFVGNDAIFGALLTLHVLGAVVGLGPTFAFPILGPLAGKAGPAGVWILEAMEKIERGIVIPTLVVVQLGTGILLIFNRNLDEGFFSAERAWLVASIVVFFAALVIAIVVVTPATATAIRLMKEGKAGSPEFLRAVKTGQVFGPVLTLMSITIIVLMVWKPGGGCGPLYRC